MLWIVTNTLLRPVATVGVLGSLGLCSINRPVWEKSPKVRCIPNRNPSTPKLERSVLRSCLPCCVHLRVVVGAQRGPQWCLLLMGAAQEHQLWRPQEQKHQLRWRQSQQLHQWQRRPQRQRQIDAKRELGAKGSFLNVKNKKNRRLVFHACEFPATWAGG